jgi:hypothetical protein
MTRRPGQLGLFASGPSNPSLEIKRALKTALSKCGKSRDEVVDLLNVAAEAAGMGVKATLAILNSWTKAADINRLPSPAWLILLCYVLKDITPIRAMLAPLGLELMDTEGRALLTWARAELAKNKAVKRAERALMALDRSDFMDADGIEDD